MKPSNINQATHKLANFAFGALFTIASVASTARADLPSIASELSADDLAKVRANEDAVMTEDVDGSVWPKVFVYRKFAASPKELAAVFADYERHRLFFEGISRSDVTTWTDRQTAEVAYTMSFPVVLGITIPDEHYKVSDRASTYDSATGKAYQVAWSFVEATTMKFLEGSARFEPFEGGTLLAYYNFINPPKPALARLLVRQNIDRVRSATAAIGKEHQRIKEKDAALLATELTALERMLQ